MCKCVCVCMCVVCSCRGQLHINQVLLSVTLHLVLGTGSFIGYSGVPYLGSPGQWAWGPFYLCPPRTVVAGTLSFTMWSGDLYSALCTSSELSSSPPFPTRESRIPAWLLKKPCTSPILLLAQVLSSPSIPSFPFFLPSSLLLFRWWDGSLMAHSLSAFLPFEFRPW